MIVQEEFVSINASPATVERYLTDPKLMDGWRSSAVVIDPLEGELMTLGSMYRLRVKALGLTGAEYTVAERDSSHILLTMDGMWRGSELWRWFPDGNRTVLLNRVEYEVPNEALRVFVVGFANVLAQLDMRLQLVRLQQMIEKSVPQQPLLSVSKA
ncbi:MAG: SRPBCC family protein [Chloroflexaceae bacterium]|jgi:hypothetical protein|nr:SRPBCC family protein [Chloroflexaceae bacterium]